MKSLESIINRLYSARKNSPQEQLDLVIDLSRRGFLRQVVGGVALGVAMSFCNHKSIADGINGLPDMGDTDRSNLSPYQADLLGKQVILQIYASGDMLEDFDCLDYLNTLGGNLVSYSPMAGQQFNFYLIKDKEINAFALPGGYICAYNGLIYATMSEAELSSVLAHEIGHVIQHHIFRNISVANRAQWLTIAGIIAGALMAPIAPGAAIIAAQSGQGAGIQSQLSFSRDYEREADRVGQQLMYQAGFDAHAMPEFFQRMQDAYKFNANDALAFLQTHPVTVERLSEAEVRANQMPVKMRQDSIDFLLTREKCRVRQIGSEDAVKFYRNALSNKRYVNIDAQYYGLALGYYLNKDYKNSIAILNKVSSKSVQGHPMTLGLKALQLIAVGNTKLADTLYDQALQDYPNHKGLWMGQIQFLISTRNYPKAANRLDTLAQTNTSDPDVWDQYAILYSDGKYNQPVKYHYGLGSEFYYIGNYKMAMEQYQAALKLKPAKPGDTDIQDLISARIPEINAKLQLLKS